MTERSDMSRPNPTGAKTGAKTDTMTDTMTAEAFARALDRYGARLSAWLPQDRRAAEALLASSAEAAQLHRAALRVDEALGTLMHSDMPVGPASRRRASPFDFTRLATWGSVALAASLAIGFFAGAALPVTDDDSDAAVAMFVSVEDVDLGGLL